MYFAASDIVYTSSRVDGQDLLFYIQNETEAVRKVAGFLNKDLPDDVIAAIADKCTFKNLKHATETFKQPWDLTSKLSLEEQEMIANWKTQETQFYRKGNI